jgi:flagellar basal-body rod protein FlgF/flagellar basal-body rod protein FlgG
VGETVNSYGVLGGSRVDLSQGPLASTGNPLDLGIDGAGFFAIQTKQGVRYTRDGSFTQSAAGQLQTAAGEAVLDTAGKPIVAPSGALTVSADGTVSAAGGVVGRVGVFGFGSGSLTAEGANRFVASGEATAADGAVRQGALEGANQDAVHGSMQMILVQRQAEMMQKALGVFDGSFDKTAVEEIARV